MDETHFLELCRQVSAALNRADLDQLGRDGRILIDGVQLVVFFDEAADPDQVRCFADLGPQPNDDGGRWLRHLLGFNLFSSHPASGICALDPVSGHGLLVVTLSVGTETRSEQLTSALQAAVAQASALRASLVHATPPTETAA